MRVVKKRQTSDMMTANSIVLIVTGWSIVMVALLPFSESALPLAASPGTPWNDLRVQLSDPTLLKGLTPQQFNENCIQPFVVDPNSTTPPFVAIISNYVLLDHPACLAHAFCGYENCAFDEEFPIFPADKNRFVLFSNHTIDEDRLSLPEMTLEPQIAADIVHAIEFCAKHKIGLSVKVAGHSYFGASSEKGTLLIKLSTEYPRYAIGGSLFECELAEDDDFSPNNMACAVALSRGKKAVLRVGGGELFDHAYRAVSFEWNNAHPDRKYHLVGGSAGTVSAAGGWLASGGLSGTTGMRMYGVGIDQVVHMEAILPTGRHVRFGPTAWEAKVGYPRVTKVTGFCNSNPYALREEDWDWQECQDEIIFEDLWFAFRGGGGGTFGVLTSVHYQLHEYPGVLSVVRVNPSTLVDSEKLDETTQLLVGRVYIEYIVQYLYARELLNITEVDSRACSASYTASLNVFVVGYFFCYGKAGPLMVEKWQEKIENEREGLEATGFLSEVVDATKQVFSVALELDSFARLGLIIDEQYGITAYDPQIPAGRLRDIPRAGLIPGLGGSRNYADSTHTHIPQSAFGPEVIDDTIDILTLEALTTSGSHPFYSMGGAILESDDALNSLSSVRRNAAMMKPVQDITYREQYFGWLYSKMSDEFPGSSCHNHANLYEMGPLKDDWTKPCPIVWPQLERDERCISQQEAAWGTANLKHLEEIKAKLDPHSLFICTSGVGYGKQAPDAGIPVSTKKCR